MSLTEDRIFNIAWDISQQDISTIAEWKLAFARAIEQELSKQEPVYAFRRKGQPEFCTCDEARYNELAQKPTLFEVAIFYASPQPCPKCAELEAELADCLSSNKAVEAALAEVPYKGTYADVVEYLKSLLPPF